MAHLRLRIAAALVVVLAASAGHAQFTASQVAAGSTQTCAITSTGVLNCWGWNPRGELGTGDTQDRPAPAATIDFDGGAKSVSGNGPWTCAVTRAGAAKCWGRNIDGLGDGLTANSIVPIDVLRLSSGVEAVSVGGRFTCALLTGGAVTCWGNNERGQLGNGNNTQAYYPPENPIIASGVTQLAAGDSHACVLNTAGAVKCWGANTFGQLGNANTTDSNRPVDVSGLGGGVVAIAAHFQHSCALLASGALRCWGFNAFGQLGDSTNFPSAIPRDVPNLPSVSAVAVGNGHTCAALTEGGLQCWGWNSYGQIGDGTTQARPRPTDVSGFPRTSRVTLLSAGSEHNCAQTEGLGLRCWGWNLAGMLGDGTPFDRATPVAVRNAKYLPSYQGLWWKSPAGTESGWGINISQQGEVIFATWFTYDAQNQPIWLVMANGVKTGRGRYAGPIYRTTGPAFSSATWNSSAVTVTPVGSAVLTFTTASQGTFDYLYDGVFQSKAITLQAFGGRLPVCEIGAERSALSAYQDLWWASPAGSQNGWGLNIAQQGTTLFATWFTYDASGRGTWFVLPSLTQAVNSFTTFEGDIYRTTGPVFSTASWNSSSVVATNVGTARIAFSSLDQGVFTYTVNGTTQSKPILRQAYSTPATTCN